MLSSINPWDYLNYLDFLVIIVVILLILIVSIIAYRRRKKNDLIDYLLMGRRLTLPLFVGTLVPTWYGGITGVTAISYNQGIYNFFTQGFFWYITYFIFAIFIVPKISKNYLTLPHMIKDLFGRKSAYLSAIFNFVDILPIAYVISLSALIQTFFPVTFVQGCIIGSSLVAAYSMFGGFRGVVYTDIVQGIVMCLAVFLVLIVSIFSFGGISFLQNNLPESFFTITGGETFLETIIWFFIALSSLVDPCFYQRIFAAKDKKTAMLGIIISIGIWFLFDISTTFGGMYARALIKDADPNNAYLIYGLQLLPQGLKGLFIAGFLSTIISTLDSYLFLAGSTLSIDLVKSKKTSVVIFGIIVATILAIILSLVFQGNIKLIWKLLGSYFTAAMMIPVIFGIFLKKFYDYQFVLTSILTIIITAIWQFIDNDIEPLYIGSLISIVILTFFTIINFLIDKTKKAILN